MRRLGLLALLLSVACGRTPARERAASPAQPTPVVAVAESTPVITPAPAPTAPIRSTRTTAKATTGPAPSVEGICSLVPTRGLETVTVTTPDGVERSYELFIPAGVSSRAALLLSFHGLGGSGRGHGPDTGWTEFAQRRALVVAFPNGFRSWNFNAGSPDVAFARQVVAHIGARACLDPARVFASGHSNGAYFAQRLACDAPDVFASVTAYAGGNPERVGAPCSPARPVAVGLFHGSADTVVTVQQGRASRDAWVGRLSCGRVPDTEPVGDGVAERYEGCAAGVAVTWREYAGQQHAWPAEPRRSDMLARMWAFYERFPRP